jgi:Zn-dependent protease
LSIGDPTIFFTTIVVILLSLAIHEFAHAKLADVAGDPTPRVYGRVTLNPIAHLDPAGTIMILLSSMSGYGIGWGKPVPMNASRMKNPGWDHFVAVAGGPISNLIQAAVYALILRYLLTSGQVQVVDVYRTFLQEPAEFAALFLTTAVRINLALCFFNLIPLGPLDGHWMLGTFMPEPTRLKWYLWNRQVGGFVLILVVIIGQMNPEINILGMLLGPVVFSMFQFFTGVPLS